jgi:hypothetical protein
LFTRRQAEPSPVEAGTATKQIALGRQQQLHQRGKIVLLIDAEPAGGLAPSTTLSFIDIEIGAVPARMQPNPVRTAGKPQAADWSVRNSPAEERHGAPSGPPALIGRDRLDVCT